MIINFKFGGFFGYGENVIVLKDVFVLKGLFVVVFGGFVYIVEVMNILGNIGYKFNINYDSFDVVFKLVEDG